MAEDSELSEAQLRLKNKVLNSGRGITIEQAVMRATNAVQTMSTDFTLIGERDLERMRDIVKQMQGSDADHPKLTKQLYEVSHEMRGTAGTFGYQVASIAANKLCTLVDHNEDMFKGGNPVAVAAAKVHVDAIGLVLHHGPTKSIGPAENHMLDGLSALAKKLQPANA